MRERQDSKVTVSVWYDSLISGDASVRVVGSPTVTGVLRALGLASDALHVECFSDTQGAMSNQAAESRRVRFKGRFQDWKYEVWESSTYRVFKC